MTGRCDVEFRRARDGRTAPGLRHRRRPRRRHSLRSRYIRRRDRFNRQTGRTGPGQDQWDRWRV